MLYVYTSMLYSLQLVRKVQVSTCAIPFSFSPGSENTPQRLEYRVHETSVSEILETRGPHRTRVSILRGGGGGGGWGRREEEEDEEEGGGRRRKKRKRRGSKCSSDIVRRGVLATLLKHTNHQNRLVMPDTVMRIDKSQ